jgi:uncharacterized protein GlcG (DUF336 family)
MIRSHRTRFAIALAAALLAGTAGAPAMAEDPMTVEVKRMSLGTAQKIAQATIEACREKGIQIGVTVVDRDGVVQAQLRDTIAAPITVPISFKKAYTAVNFNADTSALEERADTAVGRQDFLVMSAGGVTVSVGGALIGGVGVSGAPAGETDEECAKAGVAAIQDDLEMAF